MPDNSSRSPVTSARHLRWLVALGGAGVLIGTLGIRLAESTSAVRFFDNLHWTSATLTAALVACLTWHQQRGTASAHLFGWLALGLGGYALGQVCWDIQTLVGYAEFPAPSDLFYLWLGPCVCVALIGELSRHSSPGVRRAVHLDASTIAIAVLTLMLVLYLPRQGDIDTLSLVVLIAYPTSLFAAASIAFTMIPALRLRPTLSLVLFLAGLIGTGLSWMTWNFLALDGVTIDGAWFNVSFSVAILAIAWSLTCWRLEPSANPRWDRLCEGFMRQMPLVTVIMASLAVVLSRAFSDLPEPVRVLTDSGTAMVVLLAMLRQGLLLREHDELLAAKKSLLASDEALKHEQALMRTLISTLPDLVWLKNPEGVYLDCNPRFECFYGASRMQIIGKTDYDFAPRELADFFRANDQLVIKADGPRTNEEQLKFADGSYEGLFETIKTPMRAADGSLIGVLGVARDISARKAAEEKVKTLAFYDPLTSLPNRRLLLDRLGQSLISSGRSQRFGALMLIDLDNFKSLNDTMGHDVGDQLLVSAAQRFLNCLREGDTVARLGGDEFIVILNSLGDAEYAGSQSRVVAEKIRSALDQPYHLLVRGDQGEQLSHTHQCTLSIGITLFQGTEISGDELLKRADTAMYQAKRNGRDTLCFFDPLMQEAVRTRAELENDLRAAIVEQQFRLHFQPQVDVNGRIVGAEVLLRWQHPLRGLVPPNEFIPVAEETGLIVPIGHWVLESACRQLAIWAQDVSTQHLTLAVNVSARQFAMPNFVEEVIALLTYTGADPSHLKLELTESLLLAHTEEMIAKMIELKKFSVGFSLDDFGTGYSSLSYLKRLPLDQLKIDQSFVRDVLSDTNDAAIARTIVALGQSLWLSVIAEGVETSAQREFLAKNGCVSYQGYLFGRPMELTAFEERVTGNHCLQ